MEEGGGWCLKWAAGFARLASTVSYTCVLFVQGRRAQTCRQKRNIFVLQKNMRSITIADKVADIFGIFFSLESAGAKGGRS